MICSDSFSVLEMPTFSGSAPEVVHNSRPLCLILAGFSYHLSHARGVRGERIVIAYHTQWATAITCANAFNLRLHVEPHERKECKAAAKAWVSSTEINLDIDPCISFKAEIKRLRDAEKSHISQFHSLLEVTYGFGMPMRRQVKGFNQAMTRKS